MRIALDVDGVLADVILSWIERSNLRRSRLTKEQITSWDFWRACNIDRHDFYRELSDCWKNWRSIPPTEKNLSQSTKGLLELGRVDVVTARERSTDGFVRQWLKFHDVSFDSYVSVAYGTLKADLDYDLFIDDSPLNASALVEKNRSVLLYDQPWNAGPDSSKLTRVHSLSEAIEKISRISSSGESLSGVPP